MSVLTRSLPALLAGAVLLAGSGCDSSEPVDPCTSVRDDLTIVDVATGDGEEANRGDILTVHAAGRLASNDQEFWSSRTDSDGATPFTFRLGANTVIDGWECGVPGMRVGGERTITIPPEYAYGSQGSGTTIPPNATIIFDIELLEIVDE